MARTQSKYYPSDAIFRAKVTISKDGFMDQGVQYGPYANAATAKGVATQKTRWYRNNGYKVDIVIQRAVTIWEDVE